MMKLRLLATWLALVASPHASRADVWPAIVAKAQGATVYWNAWGGDARTNAFIDWVGHAVRDRFGITLCLVKLSDTAEAVNRVLAEKAAGRLDNGSIDLVWINGANFDAMRRNALLFGPFTDQLPNMRYVEAANFVDFTLPVDGIESPWRRAQLVFLYDSARLAAPPRTMAGLLAWAETHPGRLAHPDVQDFLGATFLKQALLELSGDPAMLQGPASDTNFVAATTPLWAWYDRLRPLLWRGGATYPPTGQAARQLLGDGEIDIGLSFDPADAAASIEQGLLPATVRVFTLAPGMIGNTSYVAIPFNASHKEAAMVVADFLLDPATQAHAQDIRVLGAFSVLDLDKLPPAGREYFSVLPQHPALPSRAELGQVLPEPHPSWMTRLVEEWTRRYTR
jgi:putative thiamine transport system substrate-binding protein